MLHLAVNNESYKKKKPSIEEYKKAQKSNEQNELTKVLRKHVKDK